MKRNRAIQHTTCVISLTFSLATSSALAAPPAPQTLVETTAAVPLEQDSCLDHSVRELGMSAKKVETERRWDIASKYLHSSVAKDGTFGVRFDKGPKETLVHVTAAWAGQPKETDVQLEIEQRLRSMTEKMAQLCGVTKPVVVCALTGPDGKPGVCQPLPAR